MANFDDCPVCGGDSEGGNVVIENDFAIQERHCTECGAQWESQFRALKHIITESDRPRKVQKRLDPIKPGKMATDIFQAGYAYSDREHYLAVEMWQKGHSAAKQGYEVFTDD